MNTQFAQPDKIVNVQGNKQAIARTLGTKVNDVAYLSTNTPVDSYSILYEKTTQTCWYRGTATGTPQSWVVNDSADKLTLVTSTGTFVLSVAHTITTGNVAEYLSTVDADTIMIDLASYGKTRSLISKLTETISVKDFGAVGDGVTDDSTAVQAASDYATAQGIALVFPAGSFYLATPITMTGRVTIQGENRRTFIDGAFNYSELEFPVSADGYTTNQTSPFFFMSGLTFIGESTTVYPVTVTAQAGYSFIDCMEVHNCQFFGNLAVLCTNVISAQFSFCWFYSYYTGILAQGCTNWTISNCWFRNQRRAGIYITHNTAALNRSGGENFRISGCEFAVCCKGIYAFRHVWLSVDNCLFDYNTLPVELHGSYYAKISSSYLGAANQGSLSGGNGFVAPATIGTALYCHPAVADSNYVGASYSGATCVNCEFVNYVANSSMPVAYCEGYVSASVNYVIQNIAFLGCKFISGVASTMTTMLSISYAEHSMVQGCAFYAPDTCPNLISPYTASNSKIHTGIGNFNIHCTVGGVIVPMPYDFQSSVGIRAEGSAGVFLQGSDGNSKLGVNGAGLVAAPNPTLATSASSGSYSLPGNPAGFWTINLGGTNVKIPYYN